MNSNPSSASTTAANAPPTSNRSELIQKYYSQLNTGLERIRLHLTNPSTPADRIPWLQQKQAELNKQLAVFKEKYMGPNANATHVLTTHLGQSAPQVASAQGQPRPGPPAPAQVALNASATNVSASLVRPFAGPPQAQTQSQAQAQAQTGVRPPLPPPSIVNPPRPTLNYAATSATHIPPGHRRIPSAASMPPTVPMQQQPGTPMSPVGRPPNAPTVPSSQSHSGMVRPLNQMMVNVGSMAHPSNVNAANASSFVRLPPGGPVPPSQVNPHASGPVPPHMRVPPPSTMGPNMMMMGQRPGLSAPLSVSGDSSPAPAQPPTSSNPVLAAAASMRGGPFTNPSAAMYYNAMTGQSQQSQMYPSTTTASSAPQQPGANVTTPSKPLTHPASTKSTPKGKGLKKKTATTSTSGPSSSTAAPVPMSTMTAGMDSSQAQMQMQMQMQNQAHGQNQSQSQNQMLIHSQMQAQGQSMQRLGHVRTNSGGTGVAGTSLFMSHPMYGNVSGPSQMPMHPHSVAQSSMPGPMGANMVPTAVSSVSSGNTGTMMASTPSTATTAVGAQGALPSGTGTSHPLSGVVNRFTSSGTNSTTSTPSLTASGSYSDLKRPFSTSTTHVPTLIAQSQSHAQLRHTGVLQPIPVSGKPLAHLLVGSKASDGGPRCFSPLSERALLALADDFVERLAYTACYAAYLRTNQGGGDEEREKEKEKGEPGEGYKLEYGDVAYALDHSLGMYLPPPPPSRSAKDSGKEASHHSFVRRRQMPSLPLKPYRTGRLHKRAFNTSTLSSGGYHASSSAKKDEKKKNARKKPNATSKKKLSKEIENDTTMLDNDVMDADSEYGIEEL